MREVLEDATGLNIVEGRQITLTAYADDVLIIRETKEGVIRTTERLISNGEYIGQQFNDEKNEIRNSFSKRIYTRLTSSWTNWRLDFWKNIKL